MTRFETKLKLYLILHGNQFKPLRNDYENEVNCVKCRAKHGGVCNVRYYNYQVLFEEKGDKILKTALGYIKTTWSEDRTLMWVDGKPYPYYTHPRSFGTGWVCFGFLASE